MPPAYRLGPPLGRGARSTVHSATQLATGRRVAVKVGGLVREARALEMVRHPNVVAAIELVRRPRLLVMERIDGVTLTELIRHRGALDETQAIAIAVEIALGLTALHEKGVIHRDLKPANVMVSEQGQVKLIDLGIAHMASFDDVQPGTRYFASPEQQRGERVDVRSDLYSLGCVLAAMLAGRAMDPPELPERLIDGRHPTLRLVALVRALTSERPCHRPASAASVVGLILAAAA